MKPDWAEETPDEIPCHDCGTELSLEDTKRLGSWRGVNWTDGWEEKYRCPDCGKSGQYVQKLMREESEIFSKEIRTSKMGAVAPPVRR